MYTNKIKNSEYPHTNKHRSATSKEYYINVKYVL
jgi:hypothetical protein